MPAGRACFGSWLAVLSLPPCCPMQAPCKSSASALCARVRALCMSCVVGMDACAGTLQRANQGDASHAPIACRHSVHQSSWCYLYCISA